MKQENFKMNEECKIFNFALLKGKLGEVMQEQPLSAAQCCYILRFPSLDHL
jgi:hypothetical protein